HTTRTLFVEMRPNLPGDMHTREHSMKRHAGSLGLPFLSVVPFDRLTRQKTGRVDSFVRTLNTRIYMAVSNHRRELNMSQAIDDLRHDHDAILFALKILGRMEVLVRKGEVAASDISEFMGFLKEFVDKCHHGKEEGMLFPAVTKAAMPESGDQVAVLLSEHAQGRVFVKAMEDASAPVIKATEFA